MKCLKCGAKLNDGIKYCYYCGAEIEANRKNLSISKMGNQDKIKTVVANNLFYSKPSQNDSIKRKSLKEYFIDCWNKLSKFEKSAMIGIAIFTVMALVAFFAGRIVSGAIATVQIVLVTVVLLMKKNFIKISEIWVRVVALVVSLVLIIPYFSLFRFNLTDYAKYDWKSVVLAEVLPQPESPYGKIISNSSDCLSLDVTKTSAIQYKNYIEACKQKGFTIETETNDSIFYAFNDNGYKLSLSYYNYNSEMHIALDSALKMEKVIWPDSEMAKLLPVPKSSTGKICSNDENSFSIYIGNTTIDDYNTYVKACEEKGFTVDVQKGDKSFSAINADCYKLSVDYEGNNVIYISVSEPEFNVKFEVECIENTIFSKYDVELNIDGKFEGAVSHGDKASFDVLLKKGKHTVSFVSADDKTVDGKIEVEINKNDTIKFKVFCYASGIDIELPSNVKDDSISEETETTTNENPSTVFYSTNDYETAKKGNCGVFSYKSKSGSYDIYWIIDFDEGYVYWFTEGNGETTCDKVKIVSGTLNDKVTVTWHDGGDEWSWFLHFKYVNSPVTLIVNDHNGITTKFTTTDLNNALALRDSKTIIEY